MGKSLSRRHTGPHAHRSRILYGVASSTNRFDLSCGGDPDRRVTVQRRAGSWSVRLQERILRVMTYVTPMIQLPESEIVALEAGMRGDEADALPLSANVSCLPRRAVGRGEGVGGWGKRVGAPDMTIGAIRFYKDYPNVCIELDGKPLGKCDGDELTAGLRGLLHRSRSRASSED